MSNQSKAGRKPRIAKTEMAPTSGQQPDTANQVEPRQKRKYGRKQIQDKTKLVLNRYEQKFYELVTELQPIIQEAGIGSLPLAVGAFVQRFSFEMIQNGKP